MRADSSRAGKDPALPGIPTVLVEALNAVLEELARWCKEGRLVTVVAIDAPGASGKSTLAAQLASMFEMSMLHTDDFFEPATSTGDRRPSLGDYYDVARLRAEALEPLRAGREAVFRCFDWNAAAVSGDQVHVAPSEVVVLEGVYSASPELADLVDKVIYVDTPEKERLRRLKGLIAPEDWDLDWLAAERDYFSRVRPRESADLVINGDARIGSA